MSGPHKVMWPFVQERPHRASLHNLTAAGKMLSLTNSLL
jgi:hypothetical protein